MRTTPRAAGASPRRRARTLAVALSVLLVGTALYARHVRAQAPSSDPHKALLSHPRDSLGSSTLATTATRASAGEIAVAGPRAGPRRWRSLGRAAGEASTTNH